MKIFIRLSLLGALSFLGVDHLHAQIDQFCGSETVEGSPVCYPDPTHIDEARRQCQRELAIWSDDCPLKVGCELSSMSRAECEYFTNYDSGLWCVKVVQSCHYSPKSMMDADEGDFCNESVAPPGQISCIGKLCDANRPCGGSCTCASGRCVGVATE